MPATHTINSINSTNGLFTYNVTYDNSYNIDTDISNNGDITTAFNTWDSLIKNTLATEILYQISINVYIVSTWDGKELDQNVLGAASPTEYSYLTNREITYPSFGNIFTSKS